MRTEKQNIEMNELNETRSKILKKGYLTVKDIQDFVPCGYTRAKKVYDYIQSQIAKENQMPLLFGVPKKPFLKYMCLTEDEIVEYANFGKRTKVNDQRVII